MCSNNLKYLQNKTSRVFTTFEDFKMSRTFLFLHFTFLIRASNVVKTWCLILQVVQVKKTNSTLRHEEWKQAKNYLLRKVTCNKLEDVSHDIFKDIDLRKTMLALWPRVLLQLLNQDANTCAFNHFFSMLPIIWTVSWLLYQIIIAVITRKRIKELPGFASCLWRQKCRRSSRYKPSTGKVKDSCAQISFRSFLFC